MKKIIEVSALAFSKKKTEFKKMAKIIKNKNINHLHYDVMDNIFVKNTAFNGEYLKFLKEKIGYIISVHLMVNDVEKYVNLFINYKIDYLTFHCEPIAISKAIEILKLIKLCNIKAGIAIKPQTNIMDYQELFHHIDIITVMGVEPGFGGQKFILSTVEKLKEIKKVIPPNIIIQLDGGVNLEVIKLTKEYVDFFVSGSFLINYENDFNEIFTLIK